MDKSVVIGMPLEKVINSAKCNVKIGAIDGTAFLFCGNPKTDGLDLEALNKGSLDSYKAELERTRKSFEDRRYNPPTLEEYISGEYQKNDGESCGSWEGYQKFMKRYFTYLNILIRRIHSLEDAVDFYVDIKDRKVVDIYPSVSEENTVIIMFEGRERGLYWDMKEYFNGVHDEKEDEDDE